MKTRYKTLLLVVRDKPAMETLRGERLLALVYEIEHRYEPPRSSVPFSYEASYHGGTVLRQDSYTTSSDPDKIKWIIIAHRESVETIRARLKGEVTIVPSWESTGEQPFSAEFRCGYLEQ